MTLFISSSCSSFFTRKLYYNWEHRAITEMFWLICPRLVRLPALPFVLRVSETHPCTCTAVFLHSTLFTRRWVENINWRQSVPRLRGLEEGLGSESWLSSQEVLFLTALHKHWKRDPKKMSQTHYFHCKHADIHILYGSLSRFRVSSVSRAEGLHIFSTRYTVSLIQKSFLTYADQILGFTKS